MNSIYSQQQQQVQIRMLLPCKSQLYRLLLYCVSVAVCITIYISILNNMTEHQRLTVISKTRNEKTATEEELSRNLHISREFIPGHPKLILLLAYQKVGSTFSSMMFDLNKDMFYVYEPLDSVYTHLYGTQRDWAVPQDIYYHWNGSRRHMPKGEGELIVRLLKQIYLCDFDKMITEHLINEFWIKFLQTEALPFRNCLKSLQVGVDQCRDIISNCPSRIGQDIKKQEYCKKQLQLARTNSTPPDGDFVNYKLCMEKSRESVMSKCVPIINEICLGKQIRTVKTVRLNMAAIQHLVKLFPNLRIVHLFRDPRSVVMSRINHIWSTSGNKTNRWTVNKMNKIWQLKETDKSVLETLNNDILNEARLYCESLWKDIQWRGEIELLSPGITHQVIYESIITNPYHEVAQIYDFIQEQIPSAVLSWIRNIPSGLNQHMKNVTKIEIPSKLSSDIRKICKNVYKEFNLIK